MKRLLICLTIFYINNSYAQQAYVCVTNNSTGFRYNSNAQMWERAGFNVTDEKRLLKKIPSGWRWSDFGSQSGHDCGEINSFGLLNCNILFGELRFNKNTLRFIETYTVGYIDGKNDNKNTPGISIGTCSPL